MSDLLANEIKLTDTEKQQAHRLLDKLDETKPEDLTNWNIEASAFLTFTAIKHLGDNRKGCLNE